MAEVVRTFQVRGTALGHLAVTKDDGSGRIAETGYILAATTTVFVYNGAILLFQWQNVSESSSEETRPGFSNDACYSPHRRDSWQG